MSGRSVRDVASLTFRHSAALLGAITGSTARHLDAQAGKAAILMYHRVLPDGADVSAIEPGMYVRASVFERHLEWIRTRWCLRTLGEVLQDPPAEAAPPVVAITFDDGWRDNLTVAWPILKRHGARATIFVVRDWVSAGATDEGEFIRPDELRELAEAGVEIGAHTASHPPLRGLDASTIEREMRLSKQAVESWTQRPCRLFAYPYGLHGEVATKLARSLFRGSVIAAGGWWRPGGDPALVPRIGIHQDMSSTRPLFESRLVS